MVCVFHLADNLVTVAFLHALAVDKNRVDCAGIPRLVRTVMPCGDKQFVRHFFGGQKARAIHITARWRIADIKIGGVLLRFQRRLYSLRLSRLCLSRLRLGRLGLL